MRHARAGTPRAPDAPARDSRTRGGCPTNCRATTPWGDHPSSGSSSSPPERDAPPRAVSARASDGLRGMLQSPMPPMLLAHCALRRRSQGALARPRGGPACARIRLAGAECNLKPSSGAARSAEGVVTLAMFHCSLLVFAGAIAHHPPTQELSGDCVLARSAVV